MSNNTPINLRIKFKKVGDLQYISHLDLVRTMNKIIVRADLPLWYTEGFNPKPKMVFASPLSTGTQSLTEFMDLRLTERMDPAEAMRRLNLNMTDNMQVLEAYYAQTKLTDLKWLSYTVTVRPSVISDELCDKVGVALSKDSIKVVKKTKSGESLVDIRPFIQSADVTRDGVVLRISCVLSADSQTFLNPEYVIKYLKESTGILTSENLLSESYEIMRDAAFTENMEPFR